MSLQAQHRLFVELERVDYIVIHVGALSQRQLDQRSTEEQKLSSGADGQVVRRAPLTDNAGMARWIAAWVSSRSKRACAWATRASSVTSTWALAFR